MKSLIKMQNISKNYYTNNVICSALRKINLEINEGDFVSIIGKSGSGKSTLMNILGCLDIQTEGNYILNGQDISKITENQKAYIRNKEIGFIFQKFNLIQNLSSLENVNLPLMYRKLNKSIMDKMSLNQLIKMGLGDKIKNTPKSLSGGQQQRVAIARAIVTNPKIILADEPTGNLDEDSAKTIMDTLIKLNKSGKTLVVITHDMSIAKMADKIIKINNGQII